MATSVSPALFDQFARGWRGYVLVALIALTGSLFGATRVQVMDADEARFAQTTRQMIESGDDARVRDARQPIGAHWLQATAVNAVLPLAQRMNVIWPYRLPSALGIVLAALATLWAGSVLIGPRAAFFGAGLFAAGVFVGFEGMTAKPDAVLLGCTTLALAALARLKFAPVRTRLYAVVFWLALACGVLIQGLAAPLVAVLTLAALALWERRAAWMKPLLWWPGPLLAIAIIAPWSISSGSLLHTRFGDMRGGQQGQFSLPGYHLFLLPFLIFPATYALPAAARVAWETVRAPRDDAAHAPTRFLLAWALPILVFFVLAPIKLPHDALPAYPAIALLCGAGLVAMRGRTWRTTHPAGVVLFGVVGVVIVALMAGSATFMPGDFAADLRRAISTALIGIGVVAGAVTALIMLRRPAARAGALIACALVLSFSLRERLLPEARALNVSGETVAALTRARLKPRDDRPLWVVGYDEPSLVFLTRTSIRVTDAADAGAHAQVGDALVIEGRALQETSAELALRGLVFTPSEPPVRGLALGRGERVALFVGTLSPAPSDALAAGRPQNR